MKKLPKILIASVFIALFLGIAFKTFAEDHNISVSALVQPSNSDFQFEYTTDGTETAFQNHTLTFFVTYGAKESAGVATDATITVNFSQDLDPNGSHVTDYVRGSADTAYGGAQPVVDLVNRTITWNITNLPADTENQRLTFQLKTNENYTGTQVVHVRTKASFSNQYITQPDIETMQHYQYHLFPVTPGPTATPTPTVPPIIIPTPAPPSPRITDISFPSITDDTVTISVTTIMPATVEIRYGTSPTSRKESLKSTDFTTDHTLQLTGLEPDTTYYFEVITTAQNGQRGYSEIYKITTAHTSEPQSLNNNAITITSGNTVVLSDILNSQATALGIITTFTDYQLTYTFAQISTPIQHVEAIIRGNDGSEKIVNLTESGPFAYSASLQTGGTGNFEIYIRVTDAQGNVTEQKAARIKVIAPLQVLEKDTNHPLADTRIYLWKFNTVTQQYEPITTIPNPSMTDNAGIDKFLLPRGKYRVEANALLHDGQTIDFTLGENAGEEYPVIYLQLNPVNLMSLLENVQNYVVDTFNSLVTTLQTAANSIRYFNIIATAAMASLVWLTGLLFTIRTNIRFKHVLPFFLFFLYVALNKHKNEYIYGVITDAESKPLSGVRIEIVDLKTQMVLTHTLTNKSGRFAVRNTFKQHYIKLQASKDGYTEVEQIIETDSKMPLKIQLKPHAGHISGIKRGFTYLLGELFELLLVVSLLSELMFIFTFGIAKVLPFFILSALNLILWIFFQKEKKL